jgi:hypothetical protein
VSSPVDIAQDNDTIENDADYAAKHGQQLEKDDKTTLNWM